MTMPVDMFKSEGYGAGGREWGGRLADEDSDSIQSRKLFVGGLNYDTDENSLQAHFEQWGEIVDCVVMRDPNTKKSRGFGFVTYKETFMADDAQNNRSHLIDNREVETKRAMPRDFQGRDGGRSADNFDTNSEQFRKLFIGGLNYDTEENSLQTHFEQFGEIVDCVVMRDPNTKRSRGFGFITYKEASMIDEAQNNRPHIIDNREVETKRAMPRDSAGGNNNQTVRKMFVGGLKDDTTEEQMREVFGQFGEIENIDFVTDKKVRGFAFVTYKDYDSVDRAVLLKRHILNSRKVEVKKAVPKDLMDGGARGGMGGRGRGRSDGFGGGGYSSNGSFRGGGGGYGGGGFGQNWGGPGAGSFGDFINSGGGGGGFGSNYGGGYGGGPVKGGGYAARGQGPYGAQKNMGNSFGGGGGGGFGSDFGGDPRGGPVRRGGYGGQGPFRGPKNDDNSFGGGGFGSDIGDDLRGGPVKGGGFGGQGLGSFRDNSGYGGGDIRGGPTKGGGYAAQGQGSYGGQKNVNNSFGGGSGFGSDFGDDSRGGPVKGGGQGQGSYEDNSWGGGGEYGGGPVKGGGYSARGQGPYGGGFGQAGGGGGFRR